MSALKGKLNFVEIYPYTARVLIGDTETNWIVEKCASGFYEILFDYKGEFLTFRTQNGGGGCDPLASDEKAEIIETLQKIARTPQQVEIRKSSGYTGPWVYLH